MKSQKNGGIGCLALSVLAIILFSSIAHWQFDGFGKYARLLNFILVAGVLSIVVVMFRVYLNKRRK